MNRRDTLKWIGLGTVTAVSAVARRTVAAPAPLSGESKPKVAPLSKEFKECLVDVYGGEVLGETMFGEMLDAAKTPAETYVIGSMLQLETEGKATVRPLLARLGLSLRESGDERAHGSGFAAKLNKQPWAERFKMIQGSIEKFFLPRYLELGKLVSKEEDPEAARIAAFMGEHERSLLLAATAAATGTGDAVAPLAKILRNPLSRP
jgi:hypothetical protein